MVPRAARTSFGVDPSAGPEVEKYSTPLMLRGIARCTSDWIRSGIDARSTAAALMSVLRRGMAGLVLLAVFAGAAGAWCVAAAAYRPGRPARQPYWHWSVAASS